MVNLQHSILIYLAHIFLSILFSLIFLTEPFFFILVNPIKMYRNENVQYLACQLLLLSFDRGLFSTVAPAILKIRLLSTCNFLTFYYRQVGFSTGNWKIILTLSTRNIEILNRPLHQILMNENIFLISVLSQIWRNLGTKMVSHLKRRKKFNLVVRIWIFPIVLFICVIKLTK